MPRKKKTETVEVKEVEITMKESLEAVIGMQDFGSGWSRVNNMLQAGFSIEEIRGEKK